ncbi:MAG: VTT domain-containing protein [Bryobacterales bacterium]|nr:VTT domain-containing protein [Bryobacterales bacterium]
MKRFHDIVVALGPLGVLLFAAAESVGIPNPGGTDVLVIVIAASQPSQAPLSALMAIIGSLAGSMVFFEIMRRGGEALLARRTATGRGAKLRRWFNRYGIVTVFITALVPLPGLPFKFFAACAGALGESRLRFLWVLAVARIPRYLILAYLGAELGEESWPWVRSHTWYMAAGAVVLTVLLYVLIRFADKRRAPVI